MLNGSIGIKGAAETAASGMPKAMTSAAPALNGGVRSRGLTHTNSLNRKKTIAAAATARRNVPLLESQPPENAIAAHASAATNAPAERLLSAR